MPESAKSQLRTALSESGPLPVAPEVVDHATDVQAANMLLLIQIRNEFRSAIESQNLTLSNHGAQLDTGAQKMLAMESTIGSVKATGEETLATAKETNGKVKVLRREMDEFGPKVKTMHHAYEEQITEEEASRLRRQNLLVVPRTLGKWIQGSWHYVQIALKWLGALGLAWPFIQWLIDHGALSQIWHFFWH